jgi:hypothetical protein
MVSRITTRKQSRKQTKKAIHSSITNKCLLVPLNKINTKQLFQLSIITKDKEIMKYIGKGKIWSLTDLKQFIKDETLDARKEPIKRQYYTLIMICNEEVIGLIAGRKNMNLLPKNSSPYDLLLRMFISRKHSGRGFGKLIIKLFINYYTKIINSRIFHNEIYKNSFRIPIKLVSDIDKNNISSIKIHTANGFIHTDTITYPNKHTYERYILNIL